MPQQWTIGGGNPRHTAWLLRLRRALVPLAAWLAGLAAAWTGAAPAGDGLHNRAAAGMVLVATEHVHDRALSRSVIWLIHHGEDGSMGLMMNRPLPDHVVSTLQTELGTTLPVFHGGPVAPQELFALAPGRARTSEPSVAGLRVLRGYDSVKQAATSHSASRVFTGYTGWKAGQLDAEIAQGQWLLAPADAALLQDTDYAGIWKRLHERLAGHWT